MGCGISIFEHSQRNAREECHKQKVGVHHCGILAKNATTITTTASNPSPPPTTITLSSPSKVVSLGFSTKSTSSLIRGGGDHQDVQPHPEPNCHPTNECVLPPPLQHTYNDEATDDDHALADGDGGINLVLLHRLGSVDEGAVLDPDLEETKSTKDVNRNDDATTSAAHHHHRNNISERDEQEEVGAKIPNYDGPLWIASPSFREYCIADSDSDDSFKAVAGN